MSQPELIALRDNLVKYELAAAKYRNMSKPYEPTKYDDYRITKMELKQALETIVVTWRDILHNWLKAIPGQDWSDPNIIGKVVDSMDDFLNRSKK